MRKKNDLIKVLKYLEDLIEKKKLNNAKNSYTDKLLSGDLNKIIQKVGEESVEVLIEATSKNKKKTIYESADLIFHLLIMWSKLEIKLDDIAEELEKRKKK